MLENKSVLWIDWGRHLRSQTLSRRLRAELVEICFGGSRALRYVRSVLQTSATIRDKRPGIIIATNPSIVLGYLLLALRRRRRFKLVSDAHYVGIKAVGDSRILQCLLNFYNSRVDLVIVTNDNHARFLDGLGARKYVCQDPLPHIPAPLGPAISVSEKSVFLICSFDADEPYEAAFRAFAQLREQNYSLFVSGNYRKAQIDVDQFPWVQFLGFLPDEEYYRYLSSCSVVMDLTILEDCLVCGAYEALAAGKPLVVSRTRALRDYFGDAVVLTDNNPTAICESVIEAYERRDELIVKAESWVARDALHMNERIAGLRAKLSSLCSKEG